MLPWCCQLIYNASVCSGTGLPVHSVDVFAPGVEIYGACGGASRCKALTNSAYTWASGTSMAVPHVAGLAAIYLSAHPAAKPDEVRQAILDSAVEGMVQDSNMLRGTPNRLMYTLGVQQPGQPPNSPATVQASG